MGFALFILSITSAGNIALAAGDIITSHGISMYGVPSLPHDFVSLPQANPDAPKGGEVVFGNSGGFDSMNPYILKGRAPEGISGLTVQTLLGRNYDEPFALYGVLAESITTDDSRSFVEFTLRDIARFSDGTPVTVEDVMWSFETLGTQGSPRYRTSWRQIAKMEQTGPKSVRFTFNEDDRELPLILGLRPILQKAQWQGKDFSQSSLEAPIGSGPYIVDTFETGKFITYRKNPDWWAQDLPFYRGQHNFDQIRYEYFGDTNVTFEAFKAGVTSTFREANPEKWNTAYNFGAVNNGEIVKSEIPHHRPSGIAGFVMNTRTPLFHDWRVREAMILAFNFELINQTLNGSLDPRIQSYFGNSPFGYTPGEPAEGLVLSLLEPFNTDILPGTTEGYELPVSDGSEANRKNIKKAQKLLAEAGWNIENGVLKNSEGIPFAFEILLVNGQNDMIAAANIYVEALKRLGINARIQKVDNAQYTERTNNYAFDMTYYIRGLSLSPGNEQKLYWGSDGATTPGTRNWMGVASPAVDAIIDTMLETKDYDVFVASVQALDRVMMAGRYVVPIWYSPVSRLAHKKELYFSKYIPLYGDWLGFLPETWWYESN